MHGTTQSILKLAAFACVTALTFGLTTPTFATSNNQNPLDSSILAEIATKEFQKSATIMVEGHTPKYSTRSAKSITATENSVRQRTFEEAIDDYRRELAAMGETYSDSRTNTVINSYTQNPDGTITALATETTYLTINENNTETGYTALHKLTFSPTPDDKWEISSDQYLEPTGLLPLGEAESLVIPEAEYFDNTSRESPFSDITPASTERTDNLGNDEKGVLRAGGYNYTAMANYLEKYWNNYNPAYRSFANSGGDCTNFVSQALRAGGWKDKKGWYRNAKYWWYTSINQSRSWTAVDYWATFARDSGRTSMLSNVWQLRKGDVLQVKPKNSNQKIHTMMVSYYSNGTPYFTYHTSNRYRRSLNQVLLDWKGATFYAYRT